MKTHAERPDAAYQSSSNPLSELLPWMGLLTDDIVLCKDGSLLACYEYTGVDSEGMEVFEVDTVAEQMDRAIKSFGPEITLWFTLSRKKDSAYVSEQAIENETARAIDDAWRKSFTSRNHYRNRTYLSIMYTPKGGTGRFFNNVARLMETGTKPAQAIFGAIKLSFSGADRFMYTVDEIEDGIQKLSEMADQFWGGMPNIKESRLNGKKLLGFLNRMASPGSTQERVDIDPNQAYLDTALGDETVDVHQKHIRFHGTHRRSSTVASIKMWPNSTTPGICDTLMAAEAELTFSLAFQCLDKTEAKKYVEDLRRHQENFSKGITSRIKEMMTQQESENNNNEAIVRFSEADETLTDMGAGQSAGFLLATLVVYGDSDAQADRGYAECSKRLQEAGFMLMRETLHQLSAWAGTLPGQKEKPVRWVFALAANLSDMSPLSAVKTGSKQNAYLTQQMGRELSALTVLETDTKTPFFFNFHESDLPHGIVVGPSRMGKSVFTMFLTSQFQRYNPQVFVFDKDLTCRIPTEMHGGKHLYLGEESVPINPLSIIESKKDRDWFVNWLEILLTSRGYEMTAEDDKDIAKALSGVMDLADSGDPITLTDLANQLPSRLGEQLGRWVGEGPLAGYFDNEEDALDLSDWTTMEMNNLFSNEIVARAFLDYAFRRIYKRLDGRPTIIYIEEAWFALKDPKFVAKVDDWLRTLAKKNALLLLATQSLEELANNDAFTSMVDNIPNRIFLPNPSARSSAHLYKGKFGLNDSQVEIIRTMTPKLNYYISTPNMNRKVQAKFPPEILAYVRSDANAQKAFTEAKAQYPTNWRDAYYERIKAEF